MFLSAIALGVSAATAAIATPSFAMWPPWLSIESPVNPFDASVRGAAMLVHTALREGPAQLSDLSGTAEGIVNGARRRIALVFDATRYPNTFALRRQWPVEGTWVLRISLKTTTAIVMLDRSGAVASVRVPTELQANGSSIPRAVTDGEVDSVLVDAAKR
jgi:hypothetical protein